MDRVAVVEVSPAGRACVGSGLLLFIGALVLVGFNEASIASAHGQLFSITQAAMHVPCEADKAKLAATGAQPVYLSCPVSEVADLAKNPQLAMFAPLLGEAKGLQIKVDTKILQWAEHTSPECKEAPGAPTGSPAGPSTAMPSPTSMLETGIRSYKRRGGLKLDRLLTVDQPDTGPVAQPVGSVASPTGSTGQNLGQTAPTKVDAVASPTGTSPTGARTEETTMPAMRTQEPTAQADTVQNPTCVYTYKLDWSGAKLDSKDYGCAAENLQGMSDAECAKRCIVPGGGADCKSLAIENTGHVAEQLQSRKVQPEDGDVIVGTGYQLTKDFLAASEHEWDAEEVNGDKPPGLALAPNVKVDDIKQLLGGEERIINVDHKSAGLFLSLATHDQSVGDVRTHFQARLLPAGHTVSILAAVSKDGDQARLVPWETGLSKPVDKIAWIDFSKTTLDQMVSERIFSLNGVKPLSSWMLRVSSWAMVYVGLVMVCWPLSVAPEIFPSLGKCVAGSDAAPLLGISALIALFSCLLTTSVCWMFSGLTMRGLWLLGGAIVIAIPMVLFCSCLVPKERSSKRASYLESSISISALRQSTGSLGRSSSAR